MVIYGTEGKKKVSSCKSAQILKMVCDDGTNMVACFCFLTVTWPLQEGAKEYAMLHNPRSKCSGRRRRRHHVVNASCSNTSASAVAETKEGDSDRDTGNDWASSSSGTVSRK